MEIRWYGHACFWLGGTSVSVVTDPYDVSIGIAPKETLEADIVTVSHDHYDHGNIGLVKGEPVVISSTGEHTVRGCHIVGVSTFHDEEDGAKRGQNNVFVIEIDGVRVCHLGDLGHELNPEQVEQLLPLDVLLVPVGGTYTLDARAAASVVRALSPEVAIPMHYAIPGLKLQIDPVNGFLREMSVTDAERAKSLTVVREEESRKLKRATRVVVLDPLVS